MPELPEVETIRRQLEPRLVGHSILGSRHFASAKFSDAPAMTGWHITAVERRGKYLIVVPTVADRFAIHLGMTGRLSVGPPGPDDPYERARWDLSDGRRLVFRDVRRFGRLVLLPGGDTSGVPTLHRIGPEPMSASFTGEWLWQRVRSSNRHLKTQLLDQRAVAGIGNIYADEALWHAGICPLDRVLTRSRATRLVAAVRGVLADGIRRGGTTLRDYTDAMGEIGSNQHHLMAYGRVGRACRRCGHPMTAATVDGRTTTWCRGCQPRRY